MGWEQKDSPKILLQKGQVVVNNGTFTAQCYIDFVRVENVAEILSLFPFRRCFG